MPRFLIGSSLKMYFSHTQTIEWTRRVAAICQDHPATRGGLVQPFVIPSFTAITSIAPIARPAGMLVGAQDTHWEDSGAFTGEVSPVELAEIGVRLVEVGHAERRSIFRETDEIIAAKAAAVARNAMSPLLCVGETERTDATKAIEECIDQVNSALSLIRVLPCEVEVVVAYEPIWAIGAPAPAGEDHIRAVCQGIKDALAAGNSNPVRVIYGGSAGPGLLPLIAPAADGMFLGRFAHDPAAFGRILDEAWELRCNG